MNLADILPHARRELDARRATAGATDTEIGCWSRIVMLCEDSAVELPVDADPGRSLAAMLSVAHAALGQRIGQCGRKPSGELQSRIHALRHLRDRLMRSAIQAGAQLPSFDEPQPQRTAA